jgi:hypothetical protein
VYRDLRATSDPSVAAGHRCRARVVDSAVGRLASRARATGTDANRGRVGPALVPRAGLLQCRRPVMGPAAQEWR